MPCYLAVDLGASSGRVVAGRFDGRQLTLEEIHRFSNGPIRVGARLYWRTFQLWQDILDGLRIAGRKFGREVVSVGVDTWGVDFALLDTNDELLGAPVAYRDSRTQGALQRAFARVPRETIFAETGLQFMELNTLYQLLAMQEAGSPALSAARRMLLMPDLFHWMLCGEKSNEQTNASTTQLYNPTRGDWSSALIEQFGLPPEIFGPVTAPGTSLGPLLKHVAEETGLSGVKVVLPGSHDTASAVMAAPSATKIAATGTATDWCYISSGTWSLMGVETPAPVITEDCARWNFTNEAGVAGTTRLLKNIAGLWLLQECQRVWRARGDDYSWDELTRLAAEAPPLRAAIDTNDPRLVAPADMPKTLAELCRETNQAPPATPGQTIRLALESLALRYRQVFTMLEQLTASRLERVHIVGGGTQNRLLCQMTADACGRPVSAGPIEATAIGNVMMQAIAAGDVADVVEAREVIRRSFDMVQYEPQHTAQWDEAAEKFSLEA
ncbi:MAG: rhamnulokinase [Planctomycetales bacterium]|nr:rhamnulokinase [Planctomycetales bacterium]